MSSVCNRGEGTVPEGGQVRDPRSLGSIGDSGRSDRGEHFTAFSGIGGQNSGGGPVANQGGRGRRTQSCPSIDSGLERLCEKPRGLSQALQAGNL